MKFKTYYQIVCFVVITLGILGFSMSALAEEECLKNAWTAFNNKKYEEAIQFADKCIDEFGKIADKKQKALEDDKVPEPPDEINDAEKNRIFKQGLLNDVGTAYFIKGRSAEFLYRQGGDKSAEYKKLTEETYTACKYKHARTWDPKGWFWSPCKAALDRLPIKD